MVFATRDPGPQVLLAVIKQWLLIDRPNHDNLTKIRIDVNDNPKKILPLVSLHIRIQIIRREGQG